MARAQGNCEQSDYPWLGGKRHAEHGGRQQHESAQQHRLVAEAPDQQSGRHVEEKNADAPERHHQGGEGGRCR